MRKVLAVAVLDLRRLWMPAGAFGIAFGILPALAQGAGVQMKVDDVFPFVFGAAALVAGATFGSDFAENKASFFFARPLSTPALFVGRIAALFGLAATAYLGFIVARWLSGPEWLQNPLLPITRFQIWTLAVVWVISLFFALALAANTRQVSKAGLRGLVFGGVRLVSVLATTALMVGLFADVVMRAYDSPTPIRLLTGSYVVAAFLCSCAAIELGRTNRLRITEILNLGAYVQTGLVCAVVVIAWMYVLHPGPGAITGITNAFSSPDGSAAYVSARVDRGSVVFQPGFRVDLGSGEIQRSDRGGVTWARERLGLWHSRDGGTEVWIEQTPMLFRNARQVLTRSSPLHFQSPFGAVKPLTLPDGLELPLDWELGLSFPIDILPSSSGDLFAVRWFDKSAGLHLAFMSSRGQLSVVNLSSMRRAIRAWTFLGSGQLRTAIQQQAGGVEEMQFVDIDPATGEQKTVASGAAGNAGETLRVRFDASATRALVVSGPPAEQKVSLVMIEGSPQPPRQTLATARQVNIEADFLADGRVVVIVRQPPTSELRLFSPEGKLVFSVPFGGGFNTVGAEPFANVLSVSTRFASDSEVTLIDSTSGKVLRRIGGVSTPSTWLSGTSPPPGSPGARILTSADGKLYLLPSLMEEPRLLLPRP